MRIQGYNRTNTPKILDTLNVNITGNTTIPQPQGGAVYGYDNINITVPTEDITITQNGTYTAPSTVAGYKTVVVDIPLDDITITQNGHYTHPSHGGYDDITVNVQPDLQTKTITENGTYTPDSGYDGFSRITVDVQGGGQAVIQPLTITANGTYTVPAGVDGFNPIVVQVVPKLQDKTITTNGTYTADSGYDGLRQVIVDTPYTVRPNLLITINDNTEIESSIYNAYNIDFTIDDDTDIILERPYITHPEKEG